MEDLYERLRERIDQIGTGFPATEYGTEISFLQQIFSPEEAEMFIAMKNDYETPSEFAARTGANLSAAADQMDKLSKRGIIYRLRGDGEPQYIPFPMVVGIWEGSRRNITEKMYLDFVVAYMNGFGQTFYGNQTPVMRVIPMQTQLRVTNEVLIYDDAEAIIKRANTIAVHPCICRKTSVYLGVNCTHALETCLAFDKVADYSVENQDGRYINTEEALSILKQAEKEGLVCNVGNSQEIDFMCMCCSCCCGMLRALNTFNAPARRVVSNYSCHLDESACTNCELCLERCAVNALTAGEDFVSFDPDNCIGCGLCVTVCPSEALALKQKASEEIYEPPLDYVATNREIEKERQLIP